MGREKVFAEKVSTRVRVRPRFEAALKCAREIKAYAPHCRAILTVYGMKRLGRDAAELTALADHLTAHGLVLEMPAGPLTGIHDPTGPDRRHAAHRAATPGGRRTGRGDPTRPDHPHRRTQGAPPEPGQPPPGLGRARQTRGVPRCRGHVPDRTDDQGVETSASRRGGVVSVMCRLPSPVRRPRYRAARHQEPTRPGQQGVRR
ncbi:hypothetical protein [Embleya sp. MST-111070]|uniref:hypothetical protein n=1 Tax=Embleya sp. MST-111070 TaxID=3398231 RepID=UPI003F73FDE0